MVMENIAKTIKTCFTYCSYAVYPTTTITPTSTTSKIFTQLKNKVLKFSLKSIFISLMLTHMDEL